MLMVVAMVADAVLVSAVKMLLPVLDNEKPNAVCVALLVLI